MALELIAAVVAGFALAGVAMALRFVTRGGLPKWFVPAAAGLGMLGFTVWNEYDWYHRAAATLPQGVAVAWANAESAPWRPWTYIAPITTRFMAVDTRNAQTHPAVPDQVLVQVVMVARRQPGAQLPVLVDCAGARSAELTGADVTFAEDGQVAGAVWRDLPAADPLLAAACEGA